MKPNAQLLLLELQRDLDHIHIEHTLPINYCGHALSLLLAKIEKLEDQLAGYAFPSRKAKADFLASIRPQFASRLLYYHTVFQIEDQKPSGNAKTRRNYYRLALEKRTTSPEAQLDCYPYYRIRKVQKGRQLLGQDDFKAAGIPAKNLIRLYLEYELARLDTGSPRSTISKDTPNGEMKENDTS